MIVYKHGDMFDYQHDCYVNTINCVGAMGAGIALAFRERYPDMFKTYRRLCSEGEIAVGDCWWYLAAGGIHLANLAVKNHYRYRIRLPWARIAIRNFTNVLRRPNCMIKSVAIPRIGSVNGGRGLEFEEWSDYWPNDSEKGYVELLEPFLLAELGKCDKVKFTIYQK